MELKDIKELYKVLQKNQIDLKYEHIIKDKESTIVGFLDRLYYPFVKELHLLDRVMILLRNMIDSHVATEGNHRLAYFSMLYFMELTYNGKLDKQEIYNKNEKVLVGLGVNE